jgi:5-methylcytosine-specific restriction endonuclease McrBC regulatory subunit McrC
VTVMLKTRDNNNKEPLSIENQDDIENLSQYAGKDIRDIVKENSDLLIFPRSLNGHHDDIDKNHIYTLSDNQLITGNIMGFIGVNRTQLSIVSRFDTGENDFFPHYMLQKVFSLNIFNLETGYENNSVWDFLHYLFPYFLNNAMRQGLYKTYIRNDYNNEKFKGTVNIKKHISQNMPFNGKIAYTVREHSFDNAVTQLIRHTIEYVRTFPLGNGILSSNNETSENVRVIMENTPRYNKNDRVKIISQNSKILNHPYFTNYAILQRICLQILRNKKITFGENKNKIYGLLFDGAWLWEEYLNKVFIENNIGLHHPKNKERRGGDYLFKDGKRIYPDFVKKKKTEKTANYVGDAKYKHLDTEVDETDYYQLITYMYRYECDKGYMFFPYSGYGARYSRTREIDGVTEDRTITEIGLKIEQSKSNFREFKKSMKDAETEMCGCLIP